MRCHGRQAAVAHQVRQVQRQLDDDPGLGLAHLLPVERVEAALAAEQVHCRDCLYTPLVTLWAFLAQVLSPDGSCRAAVARLLAYLAARGEASAAGNDGEAATPSAKTDPYCKARQRLPEALVRRLAQEAGERLQRDHPAAGPLLGGRPVKIADGTTVSMPDTTENQEEYPQPSSQKKGLGFPIARLVAVFSLSCAAMLGLAIGPYEGKETGETALLRTLMDTALAAGDVLLADRYHASFCNIALLLARGVDSLFRQHQKRKVDFRRGTRLGNDDHLITLERPERPDWMDAATYATLPETITVREVRVRVAVRGFRVRSLVLVTTLLDAAVYSKSEIAKAFRCRWHVELDLRSIKQTMGMQVLRCKTPAMVRKEVWMHMLAYNLVRTAMAAAADAAGIEQPREVSFAGAVQAIVAFAPAMELADRRDVPRLQRALLRAIASHRVGDRPDRCEPRAVKRRPKPTRLLTVPRDVARKRLLRSGSTAKG